MKKKIVMSIKICFIINLFILSIFPIISSDNVTALDNGSNDIPSDLKVGDLVFMDVKPYIGVIKEKFGLKHIYISEGYADDHVAMYIGGNKFIESCPYYYRPLQNKWIGVVITPWLMLKTWATNFTFATVNTTQKIRNNAISWAKTQLGKTYPDDYHCSGLIYNAYKNAGLNLKFSCCYGEYDASFLYAMKRSVGVILFSNKPPEAIINADIKDLNSYTNQEINLDGYESTDDGVIVKYVWDFGDGNVSYDDCYYTNHKYKKPGNYTVKLTVYDNVGVSDTTSIKVSIVESDAYNPDEDNQNEPNDENNNEYQDNSREIHYFNLLDIFLAVIIIFIVFLIIRFLKKK